VRAITRCLSGALAILALSATTAVAAAPYELIVSAGGGPQPGADQTNRTTGLDFSFWRWERSSRQHLLIGASLTRVTTDTTGFGSIRAISIYPQLNLYPRRRSWGQPYFFVRALGPSYISDNRLGTRLQSRHFAFQAQVGVGIYIDHGGDDSDGVQTIVSLSWKHFSNADLFSDNDGIDVPLVLNIGVRF
jgi:lipid A 3-O-deacylase